jgi:glycosyltransferase 2 family protein
MFILIKMHLPTLLRRLASILTLLSLLAVGAWLYSVRRDLATIQWGTLWPVFALLVGMYGLSFMLSFLVWHSYIRTTASITWSRDLQLYAYSNISRRLPSGLGYLVARSAQYSAEGSDARVVLFFSAQELLLQISSGLAIALAAAILSGTVMQGIHIAILILSVSIVLFARSPVMMRLLQNNGGKQKVAAKTMMSRSDWWRLIVYGLAWLNGGVMLYVLLLGLGEAGAVGIWQTIGLWALSGTVGLITGVVPIGQFARDAALSILLTQYLALPTAILVALIFRLVLTIGDVGWSMLLTGIAYITQKEYCRYSK